MRLFAARRRQCGEKPLPSLLLRQTSSRRAVGGTAGNLSFPALPQCCCSVMSWRRCSRSLRFAPAGTSLRHVGSGAERMTCRPSGATLGLLTVRGGDGPADPSPPLAALASVAVTALPAVPPRCLGGRESVVRWRSPRRDGATADKTAKTCRGRAPFFRTVDSAQ